MRVLGISGSLRRESYNTSLLRHAGDLFEAEGAEFELYDELRTIPPFDEDDDVEGGPVAVARLRAAVAGADAVFFATPEYNSSIPGVLKNAIDWASRPRAESPLAGKPSAVIGASTSLFGAIWAQAETRKVLGSSGARVLDRELPVPQAEESLGEDGLPLDSDAREALSATLDELVELAGGAARRAADAVSAPQYRAAA